MPTSDVDIALFEDLELLDQNRLSRELEDLNFPHSVDLVRMNTVTSRSCRSISGNMVKNG